jgi:hypothetical protein
MKNKKVKFIGIIAKHYTSALQALDVISITETPSKVGKSSSELRSINIEKCKKLINEKVMRPKKKREFNINQKIKDMARYKPKNKL